MTWQQKLIIVTFTYKISPNFLHERRWKFTGNSEELKWTVLVGRQRRQLLFKNQHSSTTQKFTFKKRKAPLACGQLIAMLIIKYHRYINKCITIGIHISATAPAEIQIFQRFQFSNHFHWRVNCAKNQIQLTATTKKSSNCINRSTKIHTDMAIFNLGAHATNSQFGEINSSNKYRAK